MSETTMRSPVEIGPLTSPDGGVVLADAYATTKVQIRAEASPAAATFLGGSYGKSSRNADGDLVCCTRPDECPIDGPLVGPGAAHQVTVGGPTAFPIGPA